MNFLLLAGKFLWDNRKIVAIIVALTAFGFYNYHKGEEHVQGKWDAEKALQQQAIIDAQLSVITKERDDQNVTNEVSHAYQTKISAIDAMYAAAVDGVRGALDASAAGVPALPPCEPGHNAATCTNGLSRDSKAALLTIMHDADVQTARLVACQGWIRGHSVK